MTKNFEDQLITGHGRRLLLNEVQRRVEADAVRSEIRSLELRQSAAAPFDPIPGISIVVATHGGKERLPQLLNSLVTQSLDSRRFEILIVENGEPDGSREVVESYKKSYPGHSLRYFWQPSASAGGARNLGIDLARHSRLTFVDDDDQLEPNYLSDALSVSTGGNIVLSPIINVTPDGDSDPENALNLRISKLRGQKTSILEHPWILGFNACKLVPTWMVRNLRYREDLVSGEDLVFWAQLLSRGAVDVAVSSAVDQNAYLRILRENSVSRQKLTRAFAVTQRLQCIGALSRMDVSSSTDSGRALQSLVRAQAGFVKRYLDENHEDRCEIFAEIEALVPTSFPWDIINAGQALDLAFLYCFAPFADTSAVVAAKALAERSRVVDVITNDMSAVRKLDSDVSALADKWIDQRVVVQSPPSFSDWNLISDFADRALQRADDLNAIKGPYTRVYSRALWVGSHVAAAMFKLRHWNVKWTAEFSDPLRRDAEGGVRIGPLTDNIVAQRLFTGLASRGIECSEPESLFELVELATFVLADELIFTNQYQLEYMLSLYKVAEIRQLVSEKAVVRVHPTPPPEAYGSIACSYEVDTNAVNIAYFGNFYANRGIDDLCLALANSSSDVRRNIRLHVFSNDPSGVQEIAVKLGVGVNVYSNEYLPYMEFLNATKLFDVLLVSDVERGPKLPMNPFLPSKLSDYLGSGRAIWGLVDESSAMSRLDLQYRSSVGNVPGMVRVLEEIVGDLSRR